jgi:hypothetical protein
VGNEKGRYKASHLCAVINGETMVIYDAEVEATMQLSTEMKNPAQSTTAASVHTNPG